MPGSFSVPVTSPSGLVRGGAIARIGRRRQRRRQVALEDDEVPRPAVLALPSQAPYSSGVTPYSSTFGQVRERGLEVRVALADDQDEPGPRRGHDRPGAVVDRELVRASSTDGVARDEPDLDRPDVARDVVDDDVGPRLRVERDVARLEQPVVAPQLEAAVCPLEVEVGDADEHRARDRRRRRPDGQRDDRLVLAVAARRAGP